MRYFLACMGALSTLTMAGNGWAQSGAPDRIDWSVAPGERFRLFTEANPAAKARVEALMTAFSTGPDQPATGTLQTYFSDIVAALTGPEAETLRHSHRNKAERRYEKALIMPAAYSVSAWAPVKDQKSWLECRWAQDGGSMVVQPCDKVFVFDVAAKSVGESFGGTSVLTLTVSGSAAYSEKVFIEDKLIVALGDSFIAGEGNPDVPTRYNFPDFTQLPAKAIDKYKSAAWPGTMNVNWAKEAEWWDEPCHRSLVSWPVLSTLYAAAHAPRQVYTLVHLGCSGAAGAKGLFGPQTDVPGSVTGETTSQIEQLHELLEGSPRRVDTILMSIGGNDAGFADVIAWGTIPPNGYRFPGAAKFVDKHFVKSVRPYDTPPTRPLSRLGTTQISAETRLRELPQVYDIVENGNSTYRGLSSLPGYRPDKVLQVQYPDILHDGDGEVCRTALSDRDLDEILTTFAKPYQRRKDSWGKLQYRRYVEKAAREKKFQSRHLDDVRGGFEALRGQIPSWVPGRPFNFQFAYEPAPLPLTADAYQHLKDTCDFGTDLSRHDPDDSEVCQAMWVWKNLNVRVAANSARGWHIVNGHVDGNKNHGWCVSPTGDSLRMPVWTGTNWSPFNPNDFQAYDGDKGRWFRTANDSALGQWQPNDNDPASKKEKMYFHNGTVHPSLRMHIGYAEAVYRQAFARPVATDPVGTQ